ncbi:MAG: type II toxin-antitoxin system VapB family antitoxin [Caulobacteraceae bacterium]
MTDAPVQIRKPAVARKIRELAAATGRPITDAVDAAVDEALRKAKAPLDIAERRRRIEEIVERLHRLPRVGPPLTDEDLYDEDGLPK